ncbi:MAG: HypC/HybG/HupF family hydrogenase formation chaperone, partial [Thiobacillaceae bacterium]
MSVFPLAHRPMCLTIPMRVESVEGLMARCQALGVTREVSLLYLQHDPPAVGDYVMVHLGQAMQRVCEDDAREAWRLYGEIMAELG